MPKKLSQEEVNNYLSTLGFEMVDKPYVNAHHRHTFRCTKNHEWITSFNKIKNAGTGCPTCKGDGKLTQEHVEEYLKSRKIELVDKPYCSVRHKHTFRCEYNHEWVTDLAHIKHKGDGCPLCYSNKQQSTKLYLMYSKSCKVLKIGVSIKPEKRLSEIRRSSNFLDLELIKIYNVDNYMKARMLEQKLHNYFKKNNCSYKGFDGASEFFSITPEQVINKIAEEI